MKPTWQPRCVVAAIASAMAVGGALASSSANAADCFSLKKLALPDTTVLEAEVRPAGVNSITGTYSTVDGTELGHFTGDIPAAVCRVRVAIKPTPVSNIISEYWLPVSNWNGRFDVTGNGGTAGSLGLNNMAAPVGLGFATATSDTGHQSKDSSFALVTYKGVPEQVEDFAHRAYHVTTEVGKEIVQAFYGKNANYSYFSGCSTGGAEALSEAQRYPDDFDGIIAGAPASGYTLMWPGEVFPSWVSSTYTNPRALITKLPALHAAVLSACDAVDDIINDPRQCTFDPATIQCPAGTDSTACLTADQVTAVKKIYAGFKDPTTGAQVWPPYMPGSEDQWAGHITQNNNPPVNYFRYFVFNNPMWYYTDPTFNMESAETMATIYANDARWARLLDSTDPNLTKFHQHGKIIMYHGWKDHNIAPLHTLNYYESIVPRSNLTERNSYARLYMIAGMQHCGGGPGTDTVNGQNLGVGLLSVMQKWVERGEAPNQIVAAHLTNGVPDLTRPLCPYPQAAVWTGKGSSTDAGNYICK